MPVYCYIGNRERKGQTENPLGISVCRYDEQSGHLTVLENVAAELNVGSMFIDRGVLYCTDDRPNLPGMRVGGGGRVFAFVIDPATSALRKLSRRPSFAAMPAAIVSSGDYILAANHATRDSHITISERDEAGNFRVMVLFDESSLVLYSRGSDGSIGKPLDIWKAVGEGPIDSIQYGPHLHSVAVSPSGNLFSVCDKGADRVYLFRTENGRLVATSLFRAVAGYAPRYSAFHPTAPFLFVNNEFQPYIYTLSYNEAGILEEVCRTRVLPEGTENPGGHGQSDILVDANGKYLYNLFRQLDLISVFRVDEMTGKLERIQSLKSDGRNLRSCAIAPDGRFLLVTAVDSNNVLTYPVNPDGTLSTAVSSLTQRSPANLAFYQI